MIKTSLDLLLKSSEIDLKYFLEFLGKCLETFMWPSDNFWRIVENLRKVAGNLRNSENCQEHPYHDQFAYIL